MDQKPPVWMKKEETDDITSKSGSMDQVYPSSMNVKEELEVGANKEFVEDGSGISWSTDFIKEDPELNVEVDITDSIVATSTSYASSSARRPLLGERLLRYQPWNLSFPDDFSALCEERQPELSQVFSLAASLYAAYRVYWYAAAEYIDLLYEDEFKTVDEEWQLEDRSSATLSVDTDCVQLLANALDHPTCPLEDLPLEAVKQREQCRVQLWDDVVQRSPHIPVTSYLAYTQRVNVNLCLLAWMAVNSYSICQGVPFSMIQSVHDARCYFDRPDDQSCLQSNATDAICSVSGAILLLKCRDFSSFKHFHNCTLIYFQFLSSDRTSSILHQKLTEETLNYKNSLNNATLKYKDFKIDSLKPLEISLKW
ncbi:uncharacterized protein LOC126427173 isoform X2 [Schistocerca serialis cubense]|uniref:uncharacterized protein LOC126427173 isoform X2 n=1 Tax=Schistocerca serialis cubense TaxID=2023355 RepID=UPI00214DF92C|nr:uncharacterized protein LOC126427173 isoform X2 [Schistocerca serialis cubense]